MTPVVSTEPWAHMQIDLIDFHEFADVNDGYSWLLTCVCTFSKFLVAVPMKNKKAATITKHLINNVFKIPGPHGYCKVITVICCGSSQERLQPSEH